MRAMIYSWDFPGFRRHGLKPFLVICCGIGAVFFQAAGQTNGPSNETISNAQRFAVRIENNFRAAQKRFRTEPKNNEAAWQFARACFDFSEVLKDPDKQVDVANLGIAACRDVIQREFTNAPAHYYLALNLAQVARTKSLGALKILNEMEREWGLAGSYDEKFDYAGSDRNLGVLYLEAPGWPLSIGSRNRAKQHLERAAYLAPTYPENHLALMDAYLRWGDRKKLEREMKATEELWPKAKQEFSGETWESYWADWEKRWQKIKSKAGDVPKSVKSPADKN